ncbi:hypothetical protein OJ997_00475 [Solirubrobacter phytolaccae]|uniref:Uncharacterized protein n=1 Tax=Solirubrobacter phytolaccae TaxID=1404360 RepID=A0A9X3N2Z1_9ACTN|nr:hypothetical protein [Solirubrobacter phytolaccae]MDA0178753.1 hypothetical protein [Solirubrobacter phytolaccae]
MRRFRMILPLIGLLAALPAAAGAQERVTPIHGLGEAANAIVAGADGAMWASLPADPGRIARITTAGTVVYAGAGGFAGFPANRQPSGLTSHRGAVWFALSDGSFARLRPGAAVTTFSLTAGRPTSLASGADGALWMTVDGPDAITRFTSEPLDEVTYPTGADPRSIVAATDGALWFVEGSRLGRITPSGALSYRPVAGASPDALAADATGAIWYAQGAVVHRLDDAAAYDVGAPVAALASGPDGALWAAVDGGVARIVAGEAPTSIALEGRARAIAAGPDARMWVARDRAPYVVKITVPPTVGEVSVVDGVLSTTVRSHGLEALAAAELQQADGTWRELSRADLYGTTSPRTVQLALGELAAGVVRVTVTSAAGRTSSRPLTLEEPPVEPEPTATPIPVPTTSPTPGATPAPPPPPAGPVEGKSVEVAVVSGVVSFRAPDAKTYTRLTGKAVLPLGVLLDTESGRVRVAAQVDGATQQGTFNGGKFSVTQTATGMTELALAGALECSDRERGATASRAKKKKKRSLWGKDSGGSFRTRGNGSVATVRGTEWRTEDTCAGTTIFVREGAVSVWPRRGGRSKLVRAGQRLFSPRPG